MTPVEIALAYLDSFASGDPDKISGWVSDDFTNTQIGEIGDRFQGRELYRARLPQFLEQLGGLTYRVETTIAQDDKVVLCYELTATDGGHPLCIKGVMIIWVRDGQVARRDDYWDGLTYCRQVGIEVPFGNRD